MNPKSIHFEIPKPCHEDWAKMTPVEQGRHCASCNKVVIDMQHWSDQKLTNFFQNKEERVCGRFNGGQLNKEMFHSVAANRFSKWLLTSLLSFAIVPVFGQSRSEVQFPPQMGTVKQLPKPQKTNESDTAKNILKGVVVDSLTGETLDFVTVVVTVEERFVNSCVTDENGNFKIELPDYVPDSFAVDIAYVGYSRKRVISTKKGLNKPLKVQLAPVQTWMGEVIIRKTDQKKWWQFWK